MADIYGFKDSNVANELKRLAEANLTVSGRTSMPTGRETLTVKCNEAVTPIVGDTVAGPFSGEVHYFGEGSLDLENQSYSVIFYNTTSQTFATDDTISLTRVRDLWVVSAGSGSSVMTMVTTSAITARSGATAGTGTAVSYSYDDATGDYVTGTESPPFDIVNPYASDVSTSVVIQCHAVGDKWEIIQSECEG